MALMRKHSRPSRFFMPRCGCSVRPRQTGVPGCSLSLHRSEATGHKHRLVGTFTWYRDDALARDIPDGLYVGHVQVLRPAAQVTHEEHGPLALDAGTYRLRRQRQLEPTDVGPSEHSDRVED